jgi:hypothetical protein
VATEQIFPEHRRSPAAPRFCLVSAILSVPMNNSVLLWGVFALVGAVASGLMVSRAWQRRHLPVQSSKRGRLGLSVLAGATAVVFVWRALLQASLGAGPMYEDYGGLVEPPAMAWLDNLWVVEHGPMLWWGSSLVLVALAAACAISVYLLRKRNRQPVMTATSGQRL